jgi:hypothetical protein
MSLSLVRQFDDPAALDIQDVERLRFLYSEARNGLRRVVALGLFCFEIKTRIPHGQFQPWLKANCDEISFRTLEAYMCLTKSVLERSGFQIPNALGICRGGDLLLTDGVDLTEDARKFKDAVCEVIDGKSWSQLRLEFRSDKAFSKGGDNVWQKWIRKHHKELIKDGQTPRRKDVCREIRAEYDAWHLQQLKADTSGFVEGVAIDYWTRFVREFPIEATHKMSWSHLPDADIEIIDGILLDARRAIAAALKRIKT